MIKYKLNLPSVKVYLLNNYKVLLKKYLQFCNANALKFEMQKYKNRTSMKYKNNNDKKTIFTYL